MPICTVCKKQVEDDAKWIEIFTDGEQFTAVVQCQHTCGKESTHQLADAILGSIACAQQWLATWMQSHGRHEH